MKQARFVLKTDRAGRSNAGLVYAGLSLRLGEAVFPDEAWSDFVVIVLSWWLQASVRLLQGTRDRVEVRFMDGPYSAEVARSATGAWEIFLIEAGIQRRVRHEATIEIAPFVQSLVDVAEQALSLCREKHWWSSDADLLASSMVTLRDEVRKMNN